LAVLRSCASSSTR